jgi:hypothetical protein
LHYAAAVTTRPSRFDPWLAVAVAIAAALRIFVALRHPIDYNGYWHVFIARNLAREYGSLAHPPLFLLLLKAADALARARLVYGMVSILSGLGAVVLVHRILTRLGAGRPVPALGGLAMATSTSAIFLSCEVQSYMLAVFLILWSFLYYLDLVRADPAAIQARSRLAFSALACLAVLSEYFAGLYLLACVVAPLLVSVLRPAYGKALLRSVPRRAAADLATLAPPAIVSALVYQFIAKAWIRPLNHLPEFYFVPGSETAAAFLTRNLWTLFNVFSPAVLWSPRRAAALVLGFVASTLVAVVTERRGHAAWDERPMPGAILAVLLVAGMALGLAGKYPFGGAMRQQFLLFQFALLAGFVALDRLFGAASTVSRGLRGAIVAACGLAIAVNFGLHLPDLRPSGHDAFAIQVRTFDKEFPETRLVQVDQLNLIGFFMQHHDWSWRFLGRETANPSIERYSLEKDGRALTLVAHRDRWNFDFRDPALYGALRSALHAGDPDCFTVFCVHTNLYKPPDRRLPDLDPAVVAESVSTLASAAGERRGPIVVRGNDVYAELCSAAP